MKGQNDTVKPAEEEKGAKQVEDIAEDEPFNIVGTFNMNQFDNEEHTLPKGNELQGP